MLPYAASKIFGLLGLSIFIGLFSAVVIMLLQKGAKEQADLNAQIPFKED